MVESLLKISDNDLEPDVEINKNFRDDLERNALKIAINNQNEDMCRVLIKHNVIKLIFCS